MLIRRLLNLSLILLLVSAGVCAHAAKPRGGDLLAEIEFSCQKLLLESKIFISTPPLDERVRLLRETFEEGKFQNLEAARDFYEKKMMSWARLVQEELRASELLHENQSDLSRGFLLDREGLVRKFGKAFEAGPTDVNIYYGPRNDVLEGFMSVHLSDRAILMTREALESKDRLRIQLGFVHELVHLKIYDAVPSPRVRSFQSFVATNDVSRLKEIEDYLVPYAKLWTSDEIFTHLVTALIQLPPFCAGKKSDLDPEFFLLSQDVSRFFSFLEGHERLMQMLEPVYEKAGYLKTEDGSISAYKIWNSEFTISRYEKHPDLSDARAFYPSAVRSRHAAELARIRELRSAFAPLEPLGTFKEMKRRFAYLDSGIETYLCANLDQIWDLADKTSGADLSSFRYILEP